MVAWGARKDTCRLRVGVSCQWKQFQSCYAYSSPPHARRQLHALALACAYCPMLCARVTCPSCLWLDPTFAHAFPRYLPVPVWSYLYLTIDVLQLWTLGLGCGKYGQDGENSVAARRADGRLSRARARARPRGLLSNDNTSARARACRSIFHRIPTPQCQNAVKMRRRTVL